MKIDGNTAAVDYKYTNPLSDWRRMHFIKEGGQWKLLLSKEEWLAHPDEDRPIVPSAGQGLFRLDHAHRGDPREVGPST